jgi:hypothetical protein
LHGVQIGPSHLLSGHDSPEELPCEDEREEPDRDRLGEQSSSEDPSLTKVCIVRHDCHGVRDALCEAEADGEKEDNA